MFDISITDDSDASRVLAMLRGFPCVVTTVHSKGTNVGLIDNVSETGFQLWYQGFLTPIRYVDIDTFRIGSDETDAPTFPGTIPTLPAATVRI